MNLPSLETRARDVFRDACQSIDPKTLDALREARGRALAAPATNRARRFMLPAGAFATAIIALVVAWQNPALIAAPGEPAAQIASDATVGDEDVDLYNNLEFYKWLAAQPSVAGGVR